MRKLFRVAFCSHSQGAQGGILDQLFGKVSYLIGLTALFAVVGYVIYDQLETNLQGEVQNAITASVTKNQATGKFPGALERGVARSLSDGELSSVKVADYEVAMGHGGLATITTTAADGTTTSTINTGSATATTTSDLRNHLGVSTDRHAILIVEGIDDSGDCDTIVSTNLLIGKLLGMASFASAGTYTKIDIDSRTAGFTACDNIAGGVNPVSASIAFGYTFR